MFVVVELKYKDGVYQDAEDSWLIQESVKNFVATHKPKSVLDMGTGTGILAIQAKLSGAKEVWAADINPLSTKLAEKNAKLNKVELVILESNLFSNISKSFDLIIFNPPYLPGDTYLDLDGGRDGVEVSLLFLEQAKDHLNKDGNILLVASSLSNVEKLNNAAKKIGFNLDVINEKKLPFENLWVICLAKQ